jgi:DHA2 family methylenomycin A resistance protein-like MFS transporter
VIEAAPATRQRLTLLAVCVGQAMILLDVTIVNVALPSIQRELGVTPANLEWVINVYCVVLASLLLVGGALGDRYGRKRLYVAGLVLFTICSAACALATDDPQLIAFRALQGAGAAVMAPLTLAILVDAFPAERRTSAIGIWAGVAGLGFGLGPVLGGLLIEAFDWSAVFWVNVPLGVLGVILAGVGVRESRDPGARRLDPLGTVLVASGLVLLTYGLVETNEHHWLSAYSLALFGAAAALLALFGAWERRTPHPMVPLSLFRSIGFASANAVYVLSYVALAGMFFFLTLYFQNVRDWSALKTGLSWIPLNVPFLLVTPLAGRINASFGAGRVSALGVFVASVGMLGFTQLELGSSYLAVWPCYVLVGLGYGLAVPAIAAAAMGTVPAAHSGAGSGILNSSRQIGTALGLAVLGSISAAAVSREWDDRAVDLPPGRDEASGLVQRVAGGEGRAVGELVGPGATRPAFDSFLAGLHVAMWVAAAVLVAATVVAFLGLRATSSRPSGAPRRHDDGDREDRAHRREDRVGVADGDGQ